MADNCTILCPNDDSHRVEALVRNFIGKGASIKLSMEIDTWSSITATHDDYKLTFNRLVHVTGGDKFSNLLLGMISYFENVDTLHSKIKANVLNLVEHMRLAIGVVAEPGFVESNGHYDCIFALAESLNAIIWNGCAVIDANGKTILDGDGTSETVQQ